MKKLKLYTVIIACLLVTAAGIIQNTPLFILSVRLIITIAVFYIIGGLIQAYLKKKVFYYDNIDDRAPPAGEHEDEGGK